MYETNYKPFGPNQNETGSEEFKYTGKQEDSSGLYYFGARYYDSEIGRFITEDPIFGDLTDPQSLNKFPYCRNNPQKYIDPDGWESVAVFCWCRIYVYYWDY
ncbi:MAG: RHS repeat-associated core domain-containing protein [Candidatus Hodarchaeales archaeon]